MAFFAKKSLGQNFLKSQAALNSIVTAGKIVNTDIVLEVGPGKGALTEKILPYAQKIIAIEKDDRLIELLNEKFSHDISSKKLEIIHQDILEFDPEEMKKYGSEYKLIANIPYYITGALLRKFLTTYHQPTCMVLLLQKEVAKRIVARDEKESLLSISVKAYGTPKYIETVKAKYFSPEPKVDSAILLIENISTKFFTENNINEELFFKILHAGFVHKRKVLVSNLKGMLPEDNQGKDLREIFSELGIPEKARAEDITLKQWKMLAEKIRA